MPASSKGPLDAVCLEECDEEATIALQRWIRVLGCVMGSWPSVLRWPQRKQSTKSSATEDLTGSQSREQGQRPPGSPGR